MADRKPLEDIITSTDLENYHRDRYILRDALVAAAKAGHPASSIAKRLAGVFGHNTVTTYVAAMKTADSATHALAAAGLQSMARVTALGPIAPVCTAISLLADPAEVDAEYYAKLPESIRRALAPALLTIDPAFDQLLLDGERVSVEKLRPQY